MSKEMQWLPESYRLDEVTGIFGFPCVVRLEEGYLPPEEEEEFAQGDIISLDTEFPSDKVGAYFIQENVKEVNSNATKRLDYGVLSTDNQEVFLPYSYDGKLKVLKKIAKVHTVQELAEILPGYAELEEQLTIKTNKGDSLTLVNGTTIEIDRIIPGSKTDQTAKEPDKLVIKFEHSKEEKVAALPFNMKGKFRTKADVKKYTIKDAIERFGLPLEVKFINDEIKTKFYQDVKEGRRNLGSVTANVRLDRIVKQRVIIGHYKPITDSGNVECTEKESDKSNETRSAKNTEGSNTDSSNKDIRTRTVAVIPVDNHEIGEIPVNVCDGDMLTIYESLVSIESATEARKTVKESLCLDFEVKPGMKFFNVENEKKYENPNQWQLRPPPIPARPKSPRPVIKENEKKYEKSNQWQLRPPPLTARPKSPRPVIKAFDEASASGHPQKKLPTSFKARQEVDDYLEPITEIPLKGSGKDEKKKKQHRWNRKKSSKKEKLNVEEFKPRPPMPDPPTLPKLTEDDGLEDINKTVKIDQRLLAPPPPELGEYEEINVVNPPPRPGVCAKSNDDGKFLSGDDENEYVKALHKEAKTKSESSRHKDTDDDPKTSGTSNSIRNSYQTHSDSIDDVQKLYTPAAQTFKARSEKPIHTTKLFQDLTNEELVERLNLCNLHEMAETCREGRLDGVYFKNETSETLKEYFGLQSIKLNTFLKMRDENWVSK